MQACRAAARLGDGWRRGEELERRCGGGGTAARRGTVAAGGAAAAHATERGHTLRAAAVGLPGALIAPAFLLACFFCVCVCVCLPVPVWGARLVSGPGPAGARGVWFGAASPLAERDTPCPRQCLVQPRFALPRAPLPRRSALSPSPRRVSPCPARAPPRCGPRLVCPPFLGRCGARGGAAGLAPLRVRLASCRAWLGASVRRRPGPGARAARCGRSQLPPQSSLPFNGAGRRCAHYPPAPVCAFSLRVVLGACRRAVWGACWAGVWRLSCDPRWRHYCPGLMCLQLPCLPVRALSLSAPRPAPRLASRRKPGGRPRAEGWGGGFLALRRLAAGLFFPTAPHAVCLPIR
jgi:hypothetical protein